MDGKPAITSPVVRFVGVRDLARSTAFYRDVLGFEIKVNADGTEAVLGPVRIRLVHEREPTGSAIVFLQADDVVAWRSAIISRGGAASEIERVNWIKMSDGRSRRERPWQQKAFRCQRQSDFQSAAG